MSQSIIGFKIQMVASQAHPVFPALLSVFQLKQSQNSIFYAFMKCKNKSKTGHKLLFYSIKATIWFESF